METTMGVFLKLGSTCYPITENQMTQLEKNVEHEMETGGLWGLGFRIEAG